MNAKRGWSAVQSPAGVSRIVENDELDAYLKANPGHRVESEWPDLEGDDPPKPQPWLPGWIWALLVIAGTAFTYVFVRFVLP